VNREGTGRSRGWSPPKEEPQGLATQGSIDRRGVPHARKGVGIPASRSFPARMRLKEVLESCDQLDSNRVLPAPLVDAGEIETDFAARIGRVPQGRGWFVGGNPRKLSISYRSHRGTLDSDLPPGSIRPSSINWAAPLSSILLRSVRNAL